jgi:hypothetical protein
VPGDTIESPLSFHNLSADTTLGEPPTPFATRHRLASKDDNFFVFEDLIKQTLLAFSRDTGVIDELCCIQPVCIFATYNGPVSLPLLLIQRVYLLSPNAACVAVRSDGSSFYCKWELDFVST